MTVDELCKELSNIEIEKNIDGEPVELGIEEETLIQVLKDMIETSWGRGTLERKTIDSWLSNFVGDVFPKEYERKLALILAIHMVYYNESDICYLVKIAFRKLLHEIMVAEGDTLEEAINSTVFYPLGKVSESGSFLAYYFRKENNLSIDFFVSSTNFTTDSSKNKLSNIHNIVFLDDVSISGGQLSRHVDKLRKNSKWDNLFKEKKFYALFLISTIKAKERLKEEQIHLCAPIIMDERSQCFKKDSSIYKIFEEGIRDTIRLQSQYLSQVYGCKLLIDQYRANGELERLLNEDATTEQIKEKIKKDSLGYDDSQVLIAFEYNTPNNCLPIIWIENENWNPLFRRSDKLYTSKVVRGIEDETIYI